MERSEGWNSNVEVSNLVAVEHGAYLKGGNVCEFIQIYHIFSFNMILMSYCPREITKLMKYDTFAIDNEVITKE